MVFVFKVVDGVTDYCREAERNVKARREGDNGRDVLSQEATPYYCTPFPMLNESFSQVPRAQLPVVGILMFLSDRSQHLSSIEADSITSLLWHIHLRNHEERVMWTSTSKFRVRRRSCVRRVLLLASHAPPLTPQALISMSTSTAAALGCAS